MLLDRAAIGELTWTPKEARRELVCDLLERFSHCFLEIEYEVLWASATVNAQAVRIIARTRSSDG